MILFLLAALLVLYSLFARFVLKSDRARDYSDSIFTYALVSVFLIPFWYPLFRINFHFVLKFLNKIQLTELASTLKSGEAVLALGSLVLLGAVAGGVRVWFQNRPSK